MFKLPYAIFPPNTLKRLSRHFLGIGEILEGGFPFLNINLIQSRTELNAKEYLSICFINNSVSFAFLSLIIYLFLRIFKLQHPLLISLTVAFVIGLFIFFQQISYPRVIVLRRTKEIERNLLPALEDFLIQLNSGVPLFDILVNISNSNYGAISDEFRKAIKEINTGKSQLEAIEDLATKNPSLLFRRAIWQIANGMKAGSDMGIVIKEILHSLAEEQAIQIQRYGSQLNPLTMFYMLIAVIVPALSITFAIIIASFLNLSEVTTKLIFWGMFGTVSFFQIMFLGIIKSRRPNLLG